MRIVVRNLEKRFNARRVLRNVNFEVSAGESLVITGPNGSGKTTLIKLIGGLLSPTRGAIEFYDLDRKVDPSSIYQYIGLVGPYLQLYNDLTAWENLTFVARAREGRVNRERILKLLEWVGLRGREHDPLKAYSSGMLQRVKYVAALYHEPPVLLLDEPTANLDEAGKQWVYELMEGYRRDRVLILATNEAEEVRFGTGRVDLAG